MDIQQEKYEFIKKMRDEHCEFAIRYSRDNVEGNQTLIKQIASVGMDELPFDPSIIQRLNDRHNYRGAINFLRTLFLHRINDESGFKFSSIYWSPSDTLIKNLVTYDSLMQQYHLYWLLVVNKITTTKGESAQEMIAYLQSLNIPDKEIIQKTLSFSQSPFLISNYIQSKDKVTTTFEESGFAEFMKPKFNKSLSAEDLNKQAAILHEGIENKMFFGGKFGILKFLYENARETLEGKIANYIFDHHNHIERANFACIKYLLEQDAEKYEDDIIKLAPKINNVGEQFKLYQALNKNLGNKYHYQISKIGDQYLNEFVGEKPAKQRYYSHPYVIGGPLISVYSKYLLDRDEKQGKERVMEYVKDSHLIQSQYLNFLEETFEKDSLPYLIEAMKKDAQIVDSRYQRYYLILFGLFEKYDISPYVDDIINYAVEMASKKSRKLATDSLAKYIPLVGDKALELTKGKKVDQRIVGALILSHSDDSKHKSSLMELVEKERNDDTRDILLESLHDIKFAKAYTYEEVVEMIENADARKKLSRWSEKWLDEENLPKLYWKNGEALSPKQIRFLFYRCKRVKGLNSDVECRQLIGQLDKTKSAKFAAALLQGFQDSNSDTKIKYYLTIAALVGDDTILAKLSTLFRKTMADKRYKMCEYIVGALAIVGTNKALRFVDMLSRKYASKRRRVAEAARAALDAAAIELNITAEQLGDRIIPDFGFEDLYKTFEVNDDTYRAFVSKEFKLHFFNQDNKRRKSVPKDTPKELVKEFKQINKDIKEVVKTQQGKLESALINERKWTIEEWTEYYLNNPIMLIYVQRLIWGLFKEDQLINVFYCDDDIELYDVEDEEVDLEEGTHIRIIHPLHMSEELLKKWNDKIFDMDIELEFPIIDRHIERISEEEKDKSTSTVLMNTDIPKGADYVAGFLVKRGWIKQTGDGGRLEFNKHCHPKGIKAFANIEGPAAYYQGGTAPATIYDVSFMGKNWQDKVKLGDLPKVFYSEVIADLRALSEA